MWASKNKLLVILKLSKFKNIFYTVTCYVWELIKFKWVSFKIYKWYFNNGSIFRGIIGYFESVQPKVEKAK